MGQVTAEAPLALLHGVGELDPAAADRDGFVVRSLASTVRFSGGRVHLDLFFPMPFQQAAKLKLYNTGMDDVNDVAFSVGWTDSAVSDPAAASGPPLYFHAAHRARGPAEHFASVPLLNVTNMTGHIVGTAITFSTDGTGIQKSVLEGDPRFYVDGQKSPQGQGTGTEEWGLGGDYWQGGESSTLALGGHPNNKTSLVQSMYRWLLADAIPFGSSIQLLIE